MPLRPNSTSTLWTAPSWKKMSEKFSIWTLSSFRAQKRFSNENGGTWLLGSTAEPCQNSTLARDVSVSILDELPPVQLEQVPSGAGFRFRNDDQAPSELRQTFEIARFDN